MFELRVAQKGPSSSPLVLRPNSDTIENIQLDQIGDKLKVFLNVRLIARMR